MLSDRVAEGSVDMPNLWVVFVTGVTTGGLSCMAVQGGLLASSVGYQAEHDVKAHLAAQPRKGRRKRASARSLSTTRLKLTGVQTHLTLPIAAFLGAKLVTYTLLGFLLGWLGSILQLTPLMRGVLQILIGLFMLGTALRMFNVHPIFRYLALEPPAAVTRYIRRLARNSEQPIATPLFLGVLTVLIPCGVTQAMMALAIASGNPLVGAATMLAFTLGTTPVFFTLAYLASRLSEKLEGSFFKIVAVAVLALGLITVNAGLTLLGSPLSFASITESATAAFAVGSDTVAQATADNVITVNVTNGGYSPSIWQALAGKPATLSLVTKNTTGCPSAFVIPGLGYQRVLPETGTTTVHIPSQGDGSTLRFTCSMGMYGGQIQFVDHLAPTSTPSSATS
jgi:sulfite exporter TauE/SafE